MKWQWCHLAATGKRENGRKVSPESCSAAEHCCTAQWLILWDKKCNLWAKAPRIIAANDIWFKLHGVSKLQNLCHWGFAKIPDSHRRKYSNILIEQLFSAPGSVPAIQKWIKCLKNETNEYITRNRLTDIENKLTKGERRSVGLTFILY